MSFKTIIVILLAGTCGVSAAIGINQLRRPSGETKPETVPIVVAAVNIPRFRLVTKEDLTVRQWPKELLPEGAVTKLKDAVERAAIIPLMVGEPVLNAKLASKDAGRGLAALIPKGMRAYTIQAAQVSSNVAGFVLSGNRVDVLLHLRGKPDDETGGGSTTTLLQAVEILAVDQLLDAPADNKSDPKVLRSVTLKVTPDQAALLDLGQNMGKLTLTLRNPEDNEEAKTHPALLADIRYRQEKPLVELQADGAAQMVVVEQRGEEEEPEVFSILTLRGSQRGQVQVTTIR
jgi:pilus assembly protein CpaB